MKYTEVFESALAAPAKTVTINPGVEIQLKLALTTDEMTHIINDILSCVIEDDKNYHNPIKFDFYCKYFYLKYATNIDFEDITDDEILVFMDNMRFTRIFRTIIISDEFNLYGAIKDYALKSIDEVYKARNSALGILEAISQDYSNLNFDTTQMVENLTNPEALKVLKETLTKLG